MQNIKQNFYFFLPKSRPCPFKGSYISTQFNLEGWGECPRLIFWKITNIVNLITLNFPGGVGPPSSHLDQRLNLDKYTCRQCAFFIYEWIAICIERRTDFHAKIASLGRINEEKMYKLKWQSLFRSLVHIQIM